MKRTSPHVPIAITAGAVIVFVVTALILCPPDRISPILEWFRDHHRGGRLTPANGGNQPGCRVAGLFGGVTAYA